MDLFHQNLGAWPDGVYLQGEAIPGVAVRRLRRIPDERGNIQHLLSSEDPSFQRFGEVYASSVYKDAIKGWHKHEEMSLNYVCLVGRVKCVLLFESPTRDEKQTRVMEIFMGADHPLLLTIPPGVWNGFKGLYAPESTILNISTHAHDPSRSLRAPPYSFLAYDWERKDH